MPPRPKRPAGAPPSEPKRARFTESPAAGSRGTDDDSPPLEDVAMDLEERKARRGAVKAEGYESDSSDEGEGVVPSRRPGAADDDDDDMFGGGDDDKKDTGKKSKERFLSLGEIEGQEFGGAADRGEDDEDDEDEDPEGMGGPLTAFNMKSELAEGKFSEDGTYVRNARDPHEMHDAWLDAVGGKAEIRKAREAHRRREREEREREEREGGEAAQGGRKEEAMMEVLGILTKGETVMEALQRLGKEQKNLGGGPAAAKKGGWRKKEKAMEVDNGTANGASAEAAELGKTIERLTTLASTLLSAGVPDVYDQSFEGLLRALRRSGYVKDDWLPPSRIAAASPAPDSFTSAAQPPPPPAETAQYEYKYSPAYLSSLPPASRPVENNVQGPFGREQLDAWLAGGYFGAGGANVRVRKTGGEWGAWGEVVGR